MILVIDNYDSFTWNLVDLLRQGSQEVQVFRNDEISLKEALELQPTGILISPGPGRPSDSQVSLQIVRHTLARAQQKALQASLVAAPPSPPQMIIPLLGICLGHQMIGEVAGMQLKRAPKPMHGKTSPVLHTQSGLFRGLPQPMRVMRYHSLLLDNNFVPPGLSVCAETETGEVMGLRHEAENIWGVQFHPESILTEDGEKIIFNWMDSLIKR